MLIVTNDGQPLFKDLLLDRRTIHFILTCPQGEAQNITSSDRDNLDGPTIVWVNLFVRSFEKIDDVRMQFSVQITFRQQWNDNRSWNSTLLTFRHCHLDQVIFLYSPSSFWKCWKAFILIVRIETALSRTNTVKTPLIPVLLWWEPCWCSSSLAFLRGEVCEEV